MELTVEASVFRTMIANPNATKNSVARGSALEDLSAKLGEVIELLGGQNSSNSTVCLGYIF
jgi:hypothetical protein